MPDFSPIPGIKSIVFGPPGTGKTYSLRTLAPIMKAKGLKVRALFTDPNYSSGLIEGMEYRYMQSNSLSWTDFRDIAEKAHTLPMDSLQKLDIGRAKHTGFMTAVTQLGEFKTVQGNNYGNISTWGTDICLVLDNLTGLSRMARGYVAGGKPNPTQPEWGSMMYLVEQLLILLSTTTWAHVILIAHVEKERDEISMTVKNMLSTLGQKLAPKIPCDWNDAILSRKEGANFFWDTAHTQTDIKSMHLPFKDSVPADWGQIFGAWEKRGGLYLPGAPVNFEEAMKNAKGN